MKPSTRFEIRHNLFLSPKQLETALLLATILKCEVDDDRVRQYYMRCHGHRKIFDIR